MSPTKTKPVVDYQARGLVLTGVEFPKWRSTLNSLAQMEDSRLFWLGDALVYAELHFDEAEYLQAVADSGLAEKTAINVRSVCSRIPLADRRPGLSYSIHAEVAYLEPRDRKKWLDVAEREKLSVRDLRDRIHGRDPSPGAPEDDSPVWTDDADSLGELQSRVAKLRTWLQGEREHGKHAVAIREVERRLP